jgi:hypothetical protein
VEGVSFGQNRFDDQQTAAGRHGAVTVGENAEALRLAPVVDNVGQNAEIEAGGYALEEAGDSVCRTD